MQETQKTRVQSWVGKIPGVGNGNPLHYSCLETSVDRGDLWATVHGITKSGTQLSMHVSLISTIDCEGWYRHVDMSENNLLLKKRKCLTYVNLLPLLVLKFENFVL